MRERNKAKQFRYSPGSGNTGKKGSPERKKATVKPARPTAEEEIERYYELVHLKVPGKSLSRISAFNIMVLCGMLAAFCVGSFAMEKPVFSQIEKRDLAKMPEFSASSLFKGSLTRDIETYFADTFPFREWLVTLSAVVDESRGIRMDDVRIVQPPGGEVQDIPADASLPENKNPTPPPSGNSLPAVSPDGSSSEDSSSEASSSQAFTLEPLEDDGEPTTVSNGIFVYKGMAMSLFGTSYSNGEWYAEVLNTYHRELPTVQIYNMIIPTASEFYIPKKYADMSASQKDAIDHIYSKEDASIKKVDAWSKLAENRDKYLYFRTDHHWTGLGAYYAYTAFCEQAGLEPIRLEDCETRRLDNFIGTMYAQTQDSTLLQTPDYVDYYIFPQEYEAVRYDRGDPYTAKEHSLWGEYAVSPNCYSVFLHGDFPLIKATTNIKNGRKILVVKESFGNAFAPFLINHYEEVYVVDQRYFEFPLVDFIKQNGINELVFANNSFAVFTPYHIRCIDGLRHLALYPLPAPVPAEPDPQEEAEEPVESSEPEEPVVDAMVYQPDPEPDPEPPKQPPKRVKRMPPRDD